MVKFQDAIARPPEGERHFPLAEHLEAVAAGMGEPDGDYSSRLAFLAGLLHDVGKARKEWQDYITRKPGASSHVPHAIYGGVLYGYLADFLLEKWPLTHSLRTELQWQVMGWIRDILDHHGQLKDIVSLALPWEGFQYQDLRSLDLTGFQHWLQGWFPETDSAVIDLPSIGRWLRSFRSKWSRWAITSIPTPSSRESARYCLRLRTASLIQADRRHAGELVPESLDEDMARSAMERVGQYLEALKDDSPISRMRQQMQEAALEVYQQHAAEPLFTLNLPTGMGKTLTALRVALEACLQQRKKRIIYVAPYLSILSQVTDDLRRATGLEILQHHSLSWTDDREWDEKSILLLESWSAPVVTTTFHQLFRALFPQRAQQAMRLSALWDSFVIVDEPQVLHESVWVPFLKMMEEACRSMRAQALFVSATMPPLHYLSRPPVELAREKVTLAPRYRVQVSAQPWTEQDVAAQLWQGVQECGQVAVIANTIRDSSLIREAFMEQAGSGMDNLSVIHLHGAMTPLHKRLYMEELDYRLSHSEEPLAVISTQVIEAGVNISFPRVYRALPILPSALQAAGRVNRHAREAQGELILFPFWRQGEKDTRAYVYQNALHRQVTDQLLSEKHALDEHGLNQSVLQYYQEILRRESAEATLQKLRKAAGGAWSAVAGMKPFEDEEHRISVFVPWGEAYILGEREAPTEVALALLQSIRDKMARWGLSSVEAIYERYLDRTWMGQLSYVERKQFMGLMQYFLVPLNLKAALDVVANLQDPVEIKRITHLSEYDNDSGFAPRIGHEAEAAFW